MSIQKYTLSQALRRLKKLKGELSKQNERINDAIMYRKDKEPAFAYEESVAVRKKARTHLIVLSTVLAEANATHHVTFQEEKISLAGVLHILQELKAQIAEYKGYAPFSELRNSRETTDVKKVEAHEDVTDEEGNYKGQRKVIQEEKVIIVCNVTAAERAEKIEALEKEFEELNDMLEKANHEASFSVDLP